jgi:ribonuclease HI
VDFLLDAFQAKVIACVHGMQAAINLGITEIIVETDVALVKQAICAGDFTHSLMGSLLDEL